MSTHPRYRTHSQLTLTLLTCSLRIHVALVSVVENVDGDEQDNDTDEDEDGDDNQHPPQIAPLHILLWSHQCIASLEGEKCNSKYTGFICLMMSVLFN